MLNIYIYLYSHIYVCVYIRYTYINPMIIQSMCLLCISDMLLRSSKSTHNFKISLSIRTTRGPREDPNEGEQSEESKPVNPSMLGLHDGANIYTPQGQGKSKKT